MPTNPLTRVGPSQVETCTGSQVKTVLANGNLRRAPSGQGNLGDAGWVKDRESRPQGHQPEVGFEELAPLRV